MYYSHSFFSLTVKFSPWVFYLFGLSVIFSAVKFSIFYAVWIRPTGPVRFKLIITSFLIKRPKFIHLLKFPLKIPPNGAYFPNLAALK